MALRTSLVRRTREAKLNALINTLAIKLAKENNDPLYARFARARALWKQLQQQIIEKYRPKAARLARQIIMQGGEKKRK